MLLSLRFRKLAKTFYFGALMGLLASMNPASAQQGDVMVFAAASLKNALDDVANEWERAGHGKLKISYAASNALAKQIEAGAPADIFFSADLEWMAYLSGKGLIREGSQVNLLSNRIVLVSSKDDHIALKIEPGFSLGKTLGQGRLAMGNVDAVPAGKYGKAALERLNAWDGVKDKIAQAESVRAALLLVSRGEAPLGIVYQTDAASDPNVKIVGTFPQDSHPPIVYPIAITRDSNNPDAASFLGFARSAVAKRGFEKQGFSFIDKPASGS